MNHILSAKKDIAPLSRLSETLIGSEIVKLGNEIKEQIKQGAKIYNYTIGDFNSSIFPLPPKLKDLIKEAYDLGYTTYPPAAGTEQLRVAVSSFIKEFEGLDYASDEVLIGAGGRPMIYATYRAIVDEGDKVVYPVPSWNNNHYTHFTEGEHVVIHAKVENGFMPTAEQIAPHVKDAALIAVCSPLNPTGTTFKKEELEKICDLILAENKRRKPEEKKLYLLYDQMYWTLTYGDITHYTPVDLRPEMKDYTIFIDGISKAFAATGVRVGWALGPKKVLKKMQSINSHVGAWAPMAEQYATARYLNMSDEIKAYFEHYKTELHERLQRIYEGFVQLKKDGFRVDSYSPEAAIYLTIKLSLKGMTQDNGEKLNSQDEVTKYILSEAGLAVVPFFAFGDSHDSEWYRLSVGTCKKEDIPEMLKRLKNALARLH